MPDNDIVRVDKQKLAATIARIKADGPARFHVLADFDYTMTRAFYDGKKLPTIIAQLRDGTHLTPDYAARAQALFDTYHLLEFDAPLSFAFRTEKMHEWWSTHYQLLVECGLDKQVMDEIAASRSVRFRPGALELVDLLHTHQVPLITMSAAPAYMIREQLRIEGRLYDSAHVIANEYSYDAAGHVTGIREPIIHSLNKSETTIATYPIFETIKNRANVLLMGDALEDKGMIGSFPYMNLITIGFCYKP